LQKVKAAGIKGKLYTWIEDFLTNRKQRVRVGSAVSVEVLVTSGVPQGSVLGPLLFLIFVNDIPEMVQSCVQLFADDTKLFRRIGTFEDEVIIQEDIDKLGIWAKKWCLPFNADKCKAMSISTQKNMNVRKPYHLDGRNIEFVHEEVDLGIKFTSDLKPNVHIAAKTKRANQVLGQLKKSFLLRDDAVMLKLYKAMVRPHLEYGIQIWAPHQSKDIKKMESIQRRATKLMPSCRGLEYEERLRQVGLTTLQERRQRGDNDPDIDGEDSCQPD
jgi:hypothetical protein